MIKLRLDLRNLTERWHAISRSTRLASVQIRNRVAQGHMNGMSDGLDIAAADIETLLDKPIPPVNGETLSD